MARGIIVGASSNIGQALAQAFFSDSINLIGTYRNHSASLRAIEAGFQNLLHLDLANRNSIDTCARQFHEENLRWSFVFFCPGTLEPIGNFQDCDFDLWEKNIEVNLLGQLRFLNKILALREPTKDAISRVVFFAGGGTNGAPKNFSAYTVAKIALIKSVELLDAEFPDISFTILGPGWVNTKIHFQTLNAGKNAGAALEETLRRLEKNEFISLAQVINCCKWLLAAPKSAVGGRNFSAAGDAWGNEKLINLLKSNPDLYKLRRNGNNLTF